MCHENQYLQRFVIVRSKGLNSNKISGVAVFSPPTLRFWITVKALPTQPMRFMAISETNENILPSHKWQRAYFRSLKLTHFEFSEFCKVVHQKNSFNFGFHMSNRTLKLASSLQLNRENLGLMWLRSSPKLEITIATGFQTKRH